MNFRQFRALHDYHEQTDPRTGKVKRVLVYTGDYYTLGLNPAERKAYLRSLWILWILTAVCYLAGMLVNPIASHMLYVGSFFLIALFPLGIWGWALFRLSRAKERLTQMERDETVTRLTRYPLGTALLGVCTLIGDAYFALQGGWQFNTGVEILFATLTAAVTVCAWVSHVEARRHPAKKAA